MLAFYQEMFQLLEGIDLCITNKHITPTLILIYSAIDIVAGIERAASEGTKASFIRWVDRYLLHGSSLRCTALDLYAARCGVVHSLSPSSDLFRTGKARQVVYGWGAADIEQLRRINKGPEVIVHINDLIEAFRQGLLRLNEDLDSDPVRASAFELHVDANWFAHLPSASVKFLASAVDKAD